MSLHRVRFDCHGHNAPAYGCNHPGDMSGDYLQAADASDVMSRLAEALEELLQLTEIERPDWQHKEQERARAALENYRSQL